MKKTLIHPFLFGLAPAMMMLASNVSQVMLSDTLRSFLASFLLTLFLLGSARLILRSWPKAALITTLLLILFFSYGHVFSMLHGLNIGPVLVGRTIVVLPAFFLLVGLGAWAMLRRRSALDQWTQMFNVIGIFLLAAPAVSVSSYYIRGAIIESARPPDVPFELARTFQGEVPNIYYIVLDMRARSDVLHGIYGYDDSAFIDELESLGFYVAAQSASNYSSTLQSLSSSMNFEYINYLQDTYGSSSNNRAPLGLLLADNKITKVLMTLGYKTGAFKTNDFYTEFRSADVYIKPTPNQVRQYQNFWSLNSFEGIFLRTTLARVLFDVGIASGNRVLENTIESPYRLHRLTILNIIDHLPDFAKMKDPYFVFAHIVSPHPPYVFGPNGEELEHSEPFSLSGPARQNGGPRALKLYIDQLQYIDELVLNAIRKILAQSKTPPIIIFQSDHGPVSYSGDDEILQSNMKEQHGILNAYFFPNGTYDLLYPSVSPVNSFRIVLNTFFGEDYELLPDRHYFIPHGRPYDFIVVTDRVKSDPLAP